MIPLRRLLREYRAAGSLNELLAPSAFVDDTAFVTKSGDLGLVYRLRGVDDEGLDHAQRADVAHRFASALRLLDDSNRVYVYALKKRIDPLTTPPCQHPVAQEAIARRVAYLNSRRAALYEIDLFLVLLSTGLTPRTATSLSLVDLWRHPRRALRVWLGVAQMIGFLMEELDRAISHLHHQATAIVVHLADLGPACLDKNAAYQFLRRLVNYRPHKAVAPLISDAHLDYFMADSPVECHRRVLDVDGLCVKVLTMKEPPSATFAHMLEDLQRLPCEMVACLEWRRLPGDAMRRELRSRQRHFYHQRVSLVNYVSLARRLTRYWSTKVPARPCAKSARP